MAKVYNRHCSKGWVKLGLISFDSVGRLYEHFFSYNLSGHILISGLLIMKSGPSQIAQRTDIDKLKLHSDNFIMKCRQSKMVQWEIS